MKIEQRTGRVEIVVYTDGWPLSSSVRYDGQEIERMSVNDLHDMRYTIDRVLAQLPVRP